MRYTFEIRPQGSRMDDEPLYGLTIIDNAAPLPFLRVSQYDELTQHELDCYLVMVEADNKGVM